MEVYIYITCKFFLLTRFSQTQIQPWLLTIVIAHGTITNSDPAFPIWRRGRLFFTKIIFYLPGKHGICHTNFACIIKHVTLAIHEVGKKTISNTLFFNFYPSLRLKIRTCSSKIKIFKYILYTIKTFFCDYILKLFIVF